MRCGRTGCWRTRLKPFPNSVFPELVEGQSFSSALQRKNGASTSSARTVRGRAMVAPLTKPDLGKTWEDARVYLRPTCFVDRPHELDDNCLRIADTMVWFAAWHVSLRDNDAVKSAVVPVSELDGWIAAMPDRLAEAATAQRAGVTRPRGNLQLGERTIRLNEPQLIDRKSTRLNSRH